MNKYLKYFLIFMIPFIIGYVAESFILLNFNFANWSEEARRKYITLNCILGIACIAFNGINEIYKEEKKSWDSL